MDTMPMVVNLVPNQNSSANGFFNDINDFQYTVLQKFKERLAYQKLVEDFYKFNDLFLLRFLRARNFDLEKSILMLANYMRWRIDNNIDQIELFAYPEILEVKRIFPHSFHKTDKYGRPVFIELLSKLNITEIFQATSEERFLRYFIKENERTIRFRFPACSQSFNKIIEQYTVIIDVQDVATSLLNTRVREFLKIIMDSGQNYYPETVFKVYLINTPLLFSAVWAIVKPFVDKKTRKKIITEGKSFQKTLLENIFADDLPSFLGGNCLCAQIQGGCLFSDIGPWNPSGGIKNY